MSLSFSHMPLGSTPPQYMTLLSKHHLVDDIDYRRLGEEQEI